MGLTDGMTGGVDASAVAINTDDLFSVKIDNASEGAVLKDYGRLESNTING